MMAGIHMHSFHGNMVLSWHFQLATLATGREQTVVGRAFSLPDRSSGEEDRTLAYLSGLTSTMPITKTFLPGLMPPLMCPQNGTICKG